jgi:hypothetical protein
LTIEIQVIFVNRLNTKEVSMMQPRHFGKPRAHRLGCPLSLNLPLSLSLPLSPPQWPHGGVGFHPAQTTHLPERRPHGGQDAHRTMGSIVRGRGPRTVTGFRDRTGSCADRCRWTCRRRCP